ncbi:MAG: hypothetical protein AAB316_12045 [Bacteroidota bacterium]
MYETKPLIFGIWEGEELPEEIFAAFRTSRSLFCKPTGWGKWRASASFQNSFKIVAGGGGRLTNWKAMICGRKARRGQKGVFKNVAESWGNVAPKFKTEGFANDYWRPSKITSLPSTNTQQWQET